MCVFSEEDSALLPYLGAEDVLDEVVTLLARLENDRIDILKALENEKQKVVRLNDKIDHLCLVRMRELPIAVQRGRLFFLVTKIFRFPRFFYLKSHQRQHCLSVQLLI